MKGYTMYSIVVSSKGTLSLTTTLRTEPTY